jgi:hypothetical protein
MLRHIGHRLWETEEEEVDHHHVGSSNKTTEMTRTMRIMKKTITGRNVGQDPEKNV